MAYIGVFDSGLGGLSVLYTLINTFPNESFVYIADTAHVPYGDKDHQQLNTILQQQLAYFQDAKATIVACNTLSTLLFTQKYFNPTINIISTMVHTLITDYPTLHNIGILATSFTSNSKTYNTLIHQKNPTINIYTTVAPLLVPILEGLSSLSLDNTLEDYLDFFPKDLEGLILGCTHYNLLQKNINTLRPNLKIIDPYRGVIKTLKQLLKNNSSPPPKHKFLTTAYSLHLQEQSEKIMHRSIDWEEITIVS